MLNIAEIGAIIIIIIGAIIGYQRGFLGIVYSVVSWLFIISFVVITNPYITTFFVNNTSLDSVIEKRVSSYIEEKADNLIKEEGREGKNYENDEVDELGVFESTLAVFLPKTVYDTIDDSIQAVAGQIEDKSSDLKKVFLKTASSGVTTYIIQGIAFIISFIIAKAICIVVEKLLKSIRRFPVIRGISSVIGILVGMFNDLIVICIIMYIISISLTNEIFAYLYLQVYESRALSYLYENNFLVDLIVSRNIGF